jgi:hypothetical protein
MARKNSIDSKSIEYYCEQEIKNDFNEFQNNPLNKDQYDIFCNELKMLPKEIYDRIKCEIKFVQLSIKNNLPMPACYLNIKDIESGTQGIIFLTPYVFGAPHIDENNNPIKCPGEAIYILHEIAHHVLGHREREYKLNPKTMDKEADRMADEWRSKWINVH